MTRRPVSARAEALRKAREAKQDRDAQRAQHDKALDVALIDYYQATARAERIRAAARSKADAVITAAEDKAACFVTAARDAIGKLRDLGVPVHEIAQLCRISVAKTREYLTAPTVAESTGAGTSTGNGTGADARANSAAEDDTGDEG